jgi:hypothetical protein
LRIFFITLVFKLDILWLKKVIIAFETERERGGGEKEKRD